MNAPDLQKLRDIETAAAKAMHHAGPDYLKSLHPTGKAHQGELVCAMFGIAKGAIAMAFSTGEAIMQIMPGAGATLLEMFDAARATFAGRVAQANQTPAPPRPKTEPKLNEAPTRPGITHRQAPVGRPA